jgi:hypothetical protein
VSSQAHRQREAQDDGAHTGAQSTQEKLDFDRREHLKALASGLRTQMATDVETRVGPRLRQSILSRLGQHRRVGRRRIRVTVRRGSPRDREKAECYVVTVVNLSSQRDVELKRVWVAGAPDTEASNTFRSRPLKLRPQENWIAGTTATSPARQRSWRERPAITAGPSSATLATMPSSIRCEQISTT